MLLGGPSLALAATPSTADEPNPVTSDRTAPAWGIRKQEAVAVTARSQPPQRGLPAGRGPASYRFTPPSPASDRPNVLVIVMDDLQKNDLSGPWLDNVNDLIRDRGVRFVNSYANSPICAPARASILSGKLTHNHEVWSPNFDYSYQNWQAGPYEEGGLQTWLSGAGYKTGFMGKYINGYERPAWSDHLPSGWTQWRAWQRGVYNYAVGFMFDGRGNLKRYKGYRPRVIQEQGTRMIAGLSRGTKPWFAMINYSAPHNGVGYECPGDSSTEYYGYNHVSTPCSLRGKWHRALAKRDFPSVLDSDRANNEVWKDFWTAMTPTTVRQIRNSAERRVESIGAADQSIAGLIRYLRSSGQLSNTYVFFTSDNGYQQGEHGIPNEKWKSYSESMQTPLYVRGPGLPKGKTSYLPFASIDFAPTIAGIAGADPGYEVDGLNRFDKLSRTDRHLAGKSPVLYEGSPYESVELGRTIGNQVGVRAGRWSFVRVWDGSSETYDPEAPMELYDTFRDPNELTNLARDPAYESIARELNDLTMRLVNCDGADCRIQTPASLRVAVN